MCRAGAEVAAVGSGAGRTRRDALQGRSQQRGGVGAFPGHSRGAAAGGSAGALPAGTAAEALSAPSRWQCGSQGLFSRNSGVPGKGAVTAPQVCPHRS